MENNVQELCETIKKTPLSIQECTILFHSIFDTILSLDCGKIYESNLGKHLKELCNAVDDRRATSVQYEKIYQIVTQGVEKIRKKLVEGFFSYKNIKIPKTKIHFKKIQKLKQRQERTTREHSLQCLQGSNRGEEENERGINQKKDTAFRVRRKIASVLFKKRELKRVCKKKLEAISTQIESSLRKNTRNKEQYQREVLEFLHKLERGRLSIHKEEFMEHQILEEIEKLLTA